MDPYKIIQIGMLIILLATQIIPKIRNNVYKTIKEGDGVKPPYFVIAVIVIIIIIIIITASPAY